EFGLFVGLSEDIDGMVHMSDIDWQRPGEEAIKDFTKGDIVKAKILEVDVEKERISLGMKQLSDDPMAGKTDGMKKGQIITCTVTAIVDNGIEVMVDDVMPGFIRRSDLSRDRSEQRPDRFAVGEKVDARITTIDKSGRKATLSIKAKEVAEEKEAMREYGSSDSGASLGDILGAALRSREEASATEEDTAEEDTAEEDAVEEATAEEATAEPDAAVEDTAEEDAKSSE
ncbi:MAG: S1 RNA-binding domain-containing protein, partial [Rhodospirillaceae bacterium]|nr:S1 RNA-binding domain-containing protein [Rhodospirillaceae bacterium]